MIDDGIDWVKVSLFMLHAEAVSLAVEMLATKRVIDQQEREGVPRDYSFDSGSRWWREHDRLKHRTVDIAYRQAKIKEKAAQITATQKADRFAVCLRWKA